MSYTKGQVTALQQDLAERLNELDFDGETFAQYCASRVPEGKVEETATVEVSGLRFEVSLAVDEDGDIEIEATVSATKDVPQETKDIVLKQLLLVVEVDGKRVKQDHFEGRFHSDDSDLLPFAVIDTDQATLNTSPDEPNGSVTLTVALRDHPADHEES
jgi:hypothetical protein